VNALVRSQRSHRCVAGSRAADRDNLPAQALYEGLGWKRDNDFYVYAIEP